MNTTRASLLARLKDLDNSTAWQDFDRLYRPMLHRFVRASGVNGHVGDDIVQECMASITQHIDRFQHNPGHGAFRAWLRTMVVHRVLNLQRGRHEVQAESKHLRGLADDGPTPEEIFDQICREEHLRHCIDETREEVEESTYQAFHKHVLDEESVDEVCRALHMTPNQVHKIKWRVTRKIAEKMKDFEY